MGGTNFPIDTKHKSDQRVGENDDDQTRGSRGRKHFGHLLYWPSIGPKDAVGWCLITWCCGVVYTFSLSIYTVTRTFGQGSWRNSFWWISIHQADRTSRYLLASMGAWAEFNSSERRPLLFLVKNRLACNWIETGPQVRVLCLFLSSGSIYVGGQLSFGRFSFFRTKRHTEKSR